MNIQKIKKNFTDESKIQIHNTETNPNLGPTRRN